MLILCINIKIFLSWIKQVAKIFLYYETTSTIFIYICKCIENILDGYVIKNKYSWITKLKIKGKSQIIYRCCHPALLSFFPLYFYTLFSFITSPCCTPLLTPLLENRISKLPCCTSILSFVHMSYSVLLQQLSEYHGKLMIRNVISTFYSLDEYLFRSYCRS